MKTFRQFITEVEAKNSIERLHPFRTMKMGGVKDGKFVYPHHLRLFKKVKLDRDKKINSQYKDINNPKKPSEKDLINGLPIKKA